jgi:hypothetical protein
MADQYYIANIIDDFLFALIILFAFIHSCFILFIRRFRHRNNIFIVNICFSLISNSIYFVIYFTMQYFDIRHSRGKKRDFRTPEVRREYEGSTRKYGKYGSLAFSPLSTSYQICLKYRTFCCRRQLLLTEMHAKYVIHNLTTIFF